MATFPYYVRCAMRYAWQVGKYYLNQDKAAAICFEILADFPECTEARDLIYKIFCDEWAIYHARSSNFTFVEEWDDRPHSQRYRLAISYRHLSCWQEFDEEGEPIVHSDEVPDAVVDVEDLLSDGHMQLFVAYGMGHEPSADYAWTRFMEAVRKTINPDVALLWIAEEYADNGYFADAADVLTELCSNDPEHASARRLLAEVRWWRDYGLSLPWIPPASDGSRYRRLQPILKPNWEVGQNSLAYLLERMKVVGTAPTWEPSVDRSMERWLDKIVLDEPSPQPRREFVDWSYLDELTDEEWQQRVDFEELEAWAQAHHTKQIAEAPTPADRKRAEDHLQDVLGKEYRKIFIEVPNLPKVMNPRDLERRNWDEDNDDEEEDWEEWDEEEDEWDDEDNEDDTDFDEGQAAEKNTSDKVSDSDEDDEDEDDDEKEEEEEDDDDDDDRVLA